MRERERERRGDDFLLLLKEKLRKIFFYLIQPLIFEDNQKDSRQWHITAFQEEEEEDLLVPVLERKTIVESAVWGVARVRGLSFEERGRVMQRGNMVISCNEGVFLSRYGEVKMWFLFPLLVITKWGKGVETPCFLSFPFSSSKRSLKLPNRMT